MSFWHGFCRKECRREVVFDREKSVEKHFGKMVFAGTSPLVRRSQRTGIYRTKDLPPPKNWIFVDWTAMLGLGTDCEAWLAWTGWCVDWIDKHLTE